MHFRNTPALPEVAHAQRMSNSVESPHGLSCTMKPSTRHQTRFRQSFSGRSSSGQPVVSTLLGDVGVARFGRCTSGCGSCRAPGPLVGHADVRRSSAATVLAVLPAAGRRVRRYVNDFCKTPSWPRLAQARGREICFASFDHMVQTVKQCRPKSGIPTFFSTPKIQSHCFPTCFFKSHF